MCEEAPEERVVEGRSRSQQQHQQQHQQDQQQDQQAKQQEVALDAARPNISCTRMAVSGLLLYSIFIGTLVLCSHIQSPRTLRFRIESNRPTRGFSEMKLSTSRGFGKRANADVELGGVKLADVKPVIPDYKLFTGRSFGKRDSEYDAIADQIANSIFWDLLAVQNRYENARTPKDGWTVREEANYD